MSKADITSEQIAHYRKQLDNPRIRTIINAANNNGLFKIAKNSPIGHQIPKAFSIELDTKGITDQKQSGRCWLFAILNDLRYQAADKLKIEEFQFSQSYCFFWDRLEKANLFLENMIRFSKRPLTDRTFQEIFFSLPDDGGLATNATNIINKYGLVPRDIMPDTGDAEMTNRLNAILGRLMRKSTLELRRLAAADINQAEARKQEILGDVYRILAATLGEPPAKFSWSYKDKKKNYIELSNLTPLEFKKRYTKPIRVACIFNNPSLEFNRLYKRPTNLARTNMVGKSPSFLNLPFAQLQQLIVGQLKAKRPVAFDCKIGDNVDSVGVDGYMALDTYDFKHLLDIDLTMTKADSCLLMDTADHEMLITGVTLDKNGQPTWWKVENSWGDKYGNKGYYTMRNDWFERYSDGIILPKRDLPDDVAKLLKQKPITRKLWENM